MKIKNLDVEYKGGRCFVKLDSGIAVPGSFDETFHGYGYGLSFDSALMAAIQNCEAKIKKTEGAT